MSPQKMIVISKVYYFDFLLSCLYTFNPLSLSLKWVMTLFETTYRKKCGEREVLQNYKHDKSKGVSAIHIRQMKLSWKLRNGNRKTITEDYVKSFGRVLLGVLETSILS